DVRAKIKDLPREERQKIYDYFGFELHHSEENKTGYTITGYPVNLNNGKKLAQIENPKTRAVVEELRPYVIRFSQNNQIKCTNPQVEQLLNEVVEALPEIRTAIGRGQHKTHDFDVMQHSLKVMQKVVQDPRFEQLNESDQKVLLLASLMHDITKAEGKSDKTHANESSFDTFFISKKFKLTKEEEIKLHTIIKHHEWLGYVNTAKSEEQLTKRLQSVAYDLQQNNLFDMAEIFTHADLRAVKADDRFHDSTDGKSRVSFDGTVRSYGQSADVYAQRIRGYIQELQKSQPLLPQTKMPRASRINEAITQVNPDGSTNIKGVYKDKDGLVIIKFNEVEDWEAIGFPKGSVSRGIKMPKGEDGLAEDVDTGNIKFFVHGLDYSNQLAKFDAFSLVDSDALLSVSYAERPESKFRFFRTQGVILDVNSKYVHGGGETDSGSGCGKSISEFKRNYIFGGYRESDRIFVSNLIKEATGMTDEQYVEFYEKNKDKSLSEIEPAELRETLIKAFATINSHTRRGNRAYNEMYISNPNEVMGVFAYSQDYTEYIGNPVEFLNRSSIGKHEKGYGNVGDISVKERTDFLRQYALERDLPFIIFGD
ncbi:MAG: HD domain-containing protein, partial [Alphaproteobacteria bacterium]|nr:HD domain-containing protein [Alphaproteobacteria bacterium]